MCDYSLDKDCPPSVFPIPSALLPYTIFKLGCVSFATRSSWLYAWGVKQGGPRIMESQVDSKKDLERQLKQVCEEFIMVRPTWTVFLT